MKIILLLFGLATITYGLPVSQNTDFKDGILEEDTRSNQDSFKIEEQEQFVPKSNLSEISTTTTNEVKDDSYNIETSTQIWETARDKVESDNAAWEPRDQLSATTTTEKEEVIDVSTSEFSTPARSENKEHYDQKSEENIEIITRENCSFKLYETQRERGRENGLFKNIITSWPEQTLMLKSFKKKNILKSLILRLLCESKF